MLHIAAAGFLINLERQGLMEALPDHVGKLWKAWQLRVLVVSSLGLQVALILLGKRRKRTSFILVRFSVWAIYLLAEWVATLALGVIANNIKQVEKKGFPQHGEDLMSFWAPFLLVHLGGPDTITAYSLEDNELWQRRSLELVTQTITTAYIFVIVSTGVSLLSILKLLMLIVGVIKFGERIAALRSASFEHFHDSLLMPPDPGPNYAKFMEDFTLKKAEGFFVDAIEIVEASAPTNDVPDDKDASEESKLILNAYKFFQMSKRLFVDLILSFQDRDESQAFFSRLKPKEAFHVIEVELGLIYDAFYTKAPIVYSTTGFILRFMTMLLTLIVLIMFPFITWKGQQYHGTDLVITYLLMGGAMMLEMVALLVLLLSDWNGYRLSKHYSESNNFLSRYICRRKLEKHWSTSTAQYSLLNVCLEEEKARFTIIQKVLKINSSLERHMSLRFHSVSTSLKDIIFLHCFDISHDIKDSKELTKLCRSRGDYALKKYSHLDLKWSTTEVEFDQSILLWHIATELCYYCDGKKRSSECIESKHISDYMLYLLAMRPFMLPVGIGLIRFRDTCAEAKEFFKDKNLSTSNNLAKACRMLLRVNTEISPSKVKGDRSKSVLFDACRLATSLQSLDRDPEHPRVEHLKWKIISRVWVEILGYAAIHCRGAQHAQQLRKGGELITHVWLLMAHLGITEQLQISQGHARAKLSVK